MIAEDWTMADKDLVFELPTLRPPREKGGMWKIVEDWTLYYKGDLYDVPAGFETDGASIPRFLWRVCGTPLDVPRVFAAIVHDTLYSGMDPLATRAEADALYRDLQIALGISKFKAWIEWLALRIGGGGPQASRTSLRVIPFSTIPRLIFS